MKQRIVRPDNIIEIPMPFRKLNRKEEKEFRKWARENYKKNSEINLIWHPVVQDECKKINSEA